MGFLKNMHERRIAAAQEVRAGQPVVITIARDYGAEGHEIGKMLSMELGIPLYDNELLVRSAARSGEALDKVAAYDEKGLIGQGVHERFIITDERFLGKAARKLEQ